MPGGHRQFRFGLQAKILLPVLAFLVLVPAAIVVIVTRYIRDRQGPETSAALVAADTDFQQLVLLRRTELQELFESLAHDTAIIDLLSETRGTPEFEKTIAQQVQEILNGFDPSIVGLMFKIGTDQHNFVRTRFEKSEDDDFAKAASEITKRALDGQRATATVVIKDTPLCLVGIPMNFGDAAFVVGVRLGADELDRFSKRTDTQILLVQNGNVLVHTITPDASLMEQIQPLLAGASRMVSSTPMQRKVLASNGEHFLAQVGLYDGSGPQNGLWYVLLKSYEADIATLADTQRLLVGVSLAGILVSGLTLWFLVRGFLHPLRELRDTAEAVGRGDFSKKLEVHSRDETGNLAETFNRMTTSLQTSRAELEKAVDTLKATQNQLIQSEKLSAVGQFVAGVAHELNNPLAAVIGFADLLNQTGEDPRIRPQLELIAKSAHRCHKIVQNLLSFARQRPPERSLVQINGVIDEVLEIMAYDFRTGNIEVAREFQAGLPLIKVDPHQLQQVFVNILSNARQAIEPFRADGRIRVRTMLKDAFVRIELADNGPGIRPEHLSKIFDPFFTTKPVGKGTGLGLSLVYGIIQEHGGRIGAESVLGHGATFFIELPVAADAKEAPKEAVRPSRLKPRAVQRSGRVVLVVDDEEWILALLRQLLENDGHDVVTALNGEEAITSLRRRRFDVVVCDWKMPGLNGIQFYEHLLSTDPAMAERVLFMSGDIVNETFQEFLTKRGKTCLPKPFPIEEFQAAIAAMIG